MHKHTLVMIFVLGSVHMARGAEPAWVTGNAANGVLRDWLARCRNVDALDFVLNDEGIELRHQYARREGTMVWARMTSQGHGQDGSYEREVWRLDHGRCTGVGYDEEGENFAAVSSLRIRAMEHPRPALDQIIAWVASAPSSRDEIGSWSGARRGSIEAPLDAPARSILRFWDAERQTESPLSKRWSLTAIGVVEPEIAGKPSGVPPTVWTADQLGRLGVQPDDGYADAWLVERLDDPREVARARAGVVYRTTTERGASLFAVHDPAHDRTRWLMALRHDDQREARFLCVHDDLLFVTRGYHQQLFIAELATGRAWRLEFPRIVDTYSITAKGLRVESRDVRGHVLPPTTLGFDELVDATRGNKATHLE